MTHARWVALVSMLLLGGACKEASKPAASKPPADRGKPIADAGGAAAATPGATPAVTGDAGALAASVRLDGGATLWFGFGQHEGVSDAAGLDQLVVRLVRDGKPVWQRDGLLAISGLAAVPATFELCDSIVSAIVKQSWGEASGARLSVA